MSGAPPAMKYDGPTPADVLDEDRRVGSLKAAIAPGDVTITKVDDVFRK